MSGILKIILLILISGSALSQRTSNWSLGALGKATGVNSNTTSQTSLSACYNNTGTVCMSDFFCTDAYTLCDIFTPDNAGSCTPLQAWAPFSLRFSIYFTVQSYTKYTRIRTNPYNFSISAAEAGWTHTIDYTISPLEYYYRVATESLYNSVHSFVLYYNDPYNYDNNLQWEYTIN